MSAPRGRWLVNSKTHPETTEVERSEAVATTVLQAGANVHALDWEGVTPLHMWSGGPSEGLGGVRLLLERGAEPNVAATEFRVTPLHLASSAGLARVVAELLAAQAQIDARNSIGQTPLHLASSFDRVEVVRILVEAGADRSIRDQDQETALSYARSPAARSLLEQAP